MSEQAFLLQADVPFHSQHCFTNNDEWEGSDYPHPHPLAVPFITMLISVGVLVSQVGAHYAFRSQRQLEEDNEEERGPGNALGRIVAQNGGTSIFLFMGARIVGCIALVGLSVPAVLDEANKGRLCGFTGAWLGQPYVPLLAANTYALLLAALAITTSNWRNGLIRHNIVVLLTELVVYGYRDLWPFATFTEQPRDLSEGWLLWAKIATLVVTVVVIPLCIPSVYCPVDPKAPETNLHPVQTASLLSRLFYSYLNPVISAGTRTSHLSVDELPPMADSDRANNLASRAHPYSLDPANIRKGRHIVFRIVRMFAVDYVYCALWVTLYSLSKFIAPVAVNRLLTMLESGQQKTTLVRPWLWITGIFISPVLASLSIQSYSWNMTRALAQAESILTQLVFDFSLQIRVEGDSSPEKLPATEITKGHSGEDSTDSSTTLRESEVGGSPLESTENDIQAAKTAPKPQPIKELASKNFLGKLNNLVTVDLQNAFGARDIILLLYAVPSQIIGSSILLYLILGWSTFVGFALMVALLPVPGYMAKLSQSLQAEKMKRSDSRTQIVTESMNVLRMIKLFGWEQKIQERFDQRRDEELKFVWKRKLLNALIGAVNFSIPTITMVVTYATATLVMKTELTAAKVFSSMILFDTMRSELQNGHWLLIRLIKGKVSFDRFNTYFKETELLDSYNSFEGNPPPPSTTLFETENEVIGFRNASFSWNPEPQNGRLTPSRFKLTVPGEVYFEKGKINLIVGQTGSGKTSLLMALLGEMHFTPGHLDSMFSLPRTGGVALAVQESWVQNATIRDNILFNSPYDEQRYKKVLHQCALEPDLELFEAGDMTEVGERGLTLSGGQKARLTLARAIYSNAQIILLDDVLAALDVHTSTWVVNKCFKGELVQGRTVLLVTHNIALASPIASCIVSISPDGVATGRGQDLSALLLSEPALREEYDQDRLAVANEAEPEDELIDKPSDKDKQKAGKLILAEEIHEGSVSWKSVKILLNALGGNRPIFFAVVWTVLSLFEFFMHSFRVWFLGYWGSQYEQQPAGDVPASRYLWIYVGLTFITMTVFVAKDIWYVLATMKASRTIHQMLSKSILGATLRWLDETPISRIITRMTQDIAAVDGSLTDVAETFGNLTLLMIVALLSAVLFVPIFILPGIFIAIIGMFIGSRYLKAQMSVKREFSNATAPLIAHFGEAMAGLVSIRAYGAQTTFKNENRRRIDQYVRLNRINYDLNRWIGIRIELLGAAFTASLAAYLTYVGNRSVSDIGFSLNRAVEFCTMILVVVRYFAMFQVEANSLERIIAYTEIEQEPKPTEAGKPPASWPTSGTLQVENLTARYSKTGPAILHGLSFDIRAGERIGVVGRTGSGKSSLTLALLRCILTEGTVRFDGLVTSDINLEALRSNITIIPQMPELLSGTLRYNLDPFDEYDDATLNGALRASGLHASHNESGEGHLGLDSNISSGGSNVSVGQRQIIALARAIVRSSKLLILDEATSAIDHETDTIIQNTLRRELGSDVTVLAIAHRLQTIIDADRIMVLDAGQIVEFASPAELLAKENGFFKALVDESGDRKQLYGVAGRTSM